MFSHGRVILGRLHKILHFSLLILVKTSWTQSFLKDFYQDFYSVLPRLCDLKMMASSVALKLVSIYLTFFSNPALQNLFDHRTIVRGP